MAAEMAGAEGIAVKQVVTNDDVAVKDSLYTVGRRGVAGTIFVHKIAGAKAEAGGSLDEVQALAQRVIDNVRTMGVALTACTVPHAGKPSFDLPEDQIEIGIGIHGEPGRHRVPLTSADEITATLLTAVTEDLALTAGYNWNETEIDRIAANPPSLAAIDPNAVPLGTVTVTADGPGVYTSPPVIAPTGGFVTWVWEVRKTTQPEWVRDYLATDWADEYGISVETTSVRWPVTVTSLMREYNVHPGGRAFDVITVTGFPVNHGDFAGDGYWNADVDELHHTVYGPFATDTELTDDLDLTSAPVLAELVTPARNGVYKLGYTDEDKIVPTEPGFYVLVTTFTGDDRVQPYASSPADVLERFYVPPTGTDVPVSVVTQATSEAFVGEPFSDTALVQGTKIPDGAYLVFRAYGPHPADAGAVCEVPFYESEEIPVTQAGVYRSGTTTVTEPGNVYWVESLYNADGEIIAEGVCGAPGETTVV